MHNANGRLYSSGGLNNAMIIALCCQWSILGCPRHIAQAHPYQLYITCRSGALTGRSTRDVMHDAERRINPTAVIQQAMFKPSSCASTHRIIQIAGLGCRTRSGKNLHTSNREHRLFNSPQLN